MSNVDLTDLARTWRNEKYGYYMATDQVARSLDDLRKLLIERGERPDVAEFLDDLVTGLRRLKPTSPGGTA